MDSSAEDFLMPMNFITGFDKPGNKQYETGKKIADEATTIFISETGSWSAKMPDGSSVQSYERIGYHKDTADLLRGFLAGTAAVIVARRGQACTTIKTSSL